MQWQRGAAEAETPRDEARVEVSTPFTNQNLSELTDQSERFPYRDFEVPQEPETQSNQSSERLSRKQLKEAYEEARNACRDPEAESAEKAAQQLSMIVEEPVEKIACPACSSGDMYCESEKEKGGRQNDSLIEIENKIGLASTIIAKDKTERERS